MQVQQTIFFYKEANRGQLYRFRSNFQQHRSTRQCSMLYKKLPSLRYMYTYCISFTYIFRMVYEQRCKFYLVGNTCTVILFKTAIVSYKIFFVSLFFYTKLGKLSVVHKISLRFVKLKTDFCLEILFCFTSENGQGGQELRGKEGRMRKRWQR